MLQQLGVSVDTDINPIHVFLFSVPRAAVAEVMMFHFTACNVTALDQTIISVFDVKS